jgi:hypothetical protein
MKKLVFVLILLIILSVVIFFFGWTQFRLEKNTYGVVYTKTHGFSDQPLSSGEFSWSPWALIPKNMEITQVPSSLRSVQLDADGQLPQRQLYSRVLTGDPDFTYTIGLEIDYRIKPEFAVSLIRDRGLDEIRLPGFLVGLDDSVREVASAFTQEFFSSAGSRMSPDALPEALSSYLGAQLSGYFNELILEDIQVLFSKPPDLALYEQAVEAFADLMERKQAALTQALEREPGELADHMIYLDQLESYGQLITAYPLLLDYLEIEGRYGESGE